jgi:hypothetical protein
MRDRFEELLPWYANGTLNETDRAWVDEYLRAHPSAAGQLRWYESLQVRLREDAPAVSSEIGMDRVMSRIRTEGPAPRAAQAARPVSRPFLEQVQGWIAALTPQAMLRPALAGLAVLAVVQGIVIGQLAGDSATSEIRAVRPAAVAEQGPLFKVNFKADAREADIRLLLNEVQGRLAGGPGQLGDYYVRVPATTFAAAEGRLKANAIVDAVSVVDAVPGRD